MSHAARIPRARTVLLGLIAIAGCEDGGTAAPPPSRVIAVAAEDPDARPLEELCDFLPAEADAPTYTEPTVEGPAPAAPPGWRWVNVWATWCHPCVEEMPRLARFRDRLAADGVEVNLRFVSSDTEPDAVPRFRREHPDAPASARLADPASLTSWVASVGLDQGAALPLHVFVDPAGKTRCARAGAISERDLPLVRRLLTR